MTARSGFLRRPTLYPSGIAAGGADTGFDVIGQKTVLAKRVSQVTQDIILPKGALIFSTFILPDPDAPAVAGTVALDKWDIVGNVSSQVVFAATSATAPLETHKITMPAITDPPVPVAAYSLKGVPERLSAEQRYRITPSGIGAETYVYVGFEVILPRLRP